MDLASGTINYTPADIDIVAIYQENDSGNYESVETVPASGYSLSSDSYCNVNGEKDTSIKLTYQNGSIAINDISKRTKCYLYFNKAKAIDTIIGDTTRIKEKTEFTGIATSDDTGIYSAPDDYGTSYYFRGVENKLNNWVKFAGFYWRIIRMNGNGTVRMIYQGVANGAVTSSNKTGETTQINKSMYNHTYNDNAYVGYMMGIPLNGTSQTANKTTSHSSSYTNAHTNIYDSDAKIQIDNWYKTNVLDKLFESYIDTNTGFCNDRQVNKNIYPVVGYTGNGYDTQTTSYAAWGRVFQNGRWKTVQTPTLQCINKKNDLFTMNEANEGNKVLTYPIGMITMDEVIFAGGFGDTENNTYYLNINQDYWTMSPYSYDTLDASLFCVHFNGSIHSGYETRNMYSLRPVINLRADTKFTYSNETTKGSETDPYIVS